MRPRSSGRRISTGRCNMSVRDNKSPEDRSGESAKIEMVSPRGGSKRRWLEQSFIWRPDAQQTDINGRLATMVCLVFECLQQPGKTSDFAFALTGEFPEFVRI